MVNFLFLIPATTFGLGVWQIRRLKWKQDLIKSHETTIPIEITTEMKPFPEFTKLKLSGKFQMDKTIKVERARTIDGTPKRGFLLFTLFELLNGQKVVVNRGWIPRDYQLKQQEEKEESINVMTREGERVSFFASSGSIDKLIMIDFPLIKKAIGGEYLVEVYGSTEYPLSRVHEFKNDHLQYAITWFGLSACTLGMLLFTRKRKLKFRWIK